MDIILTKVNREWAENEAEEAGRQRDVERFVALKI
jgi:hypothetical protein